METSKPYISTNCWKCKAQNNAAVAVNCRVCGAYLRTSEPDENSLSYRITDYPAFKGYLLLGLVLLLGGAAIVFFYKSKPSSDDATASKEIVLPSDSWYNKSLWSYVSNSPSVRQILKKNEEANGKTPSLETARTLSLSGKMSRAVGTCFEQMCIDERKRQIAVQQARLPPSWRWSSPDAVPVGPEPKPETSDKYDQLGFSGLGTLELLVKIPDRMVKKATVINPHDETHRRIQVIEFFNGLEGKRITDYFDATDNKVKSEVDTMDALQVASARSEQASMLGNDFDNYTDMEFRGLKKVNERVAFAVSAKNRKGEPETFFFDAVTGLVIKIDTALNSVFLDNYRPWGQGMLPYTIYFRQPELGGFHSWIKIEVDEWKIGDLIDDSVFVIPVGT